MSGSISTIFDDTDIRPKQIYNILNWVKFHKIFKFLTIIYKKI